MTTQTQTAKADELAGILAPHYASLGLTLHRETRDGCIIVGSLGAPLYHEDAIAVGSDGTCTWAGEQQAGDWPAEIDAAIRAVTGWPA